MMRTAGVVLAIVGVAKIMSAFSGVRYLAQADPVLSFLSNKDLLLLAGGVEVLLAGALLLWPHLWYARYGLFSLCTTFAVYRVGMVVMGVHSPCPCLGRASDWLHLKPKQVDSLSFSLLAGLSFIAISSIVIWNFKSRWVGQGK